MNTARMSGASASTSRPVVARVPRVLRRVALGVFCAWVAFWTWFVVASHFNEPASLLSEGAVVVLPLLTLAVLAWKKPFVAGIGLFIAAAAATWFFRNWAAFLLLAAPAFAFAAFFTWLGRRERSGV